MSDPVMVPVARDSQQGNFLVLVLHFLPKSFNTQAVQVPRGTSKFCLDLLMMLVIKPKLA